MTTRFDRRLFLKAAGLAALSPALPAWGRRSSTAWSNRSDAIRVAFVGVGGRGWANLTETAAVDGVDVVALCDVDANALATAAERFAGARTVADFRALADHAADFDALLVSTPDHTHAAAAALGLHLGKPVYCEKPLCRTVGEVRTLTDLARQADVPTQMGTQIHAGANYRRVVELVRSGAIGSVRAVHVWCGKSWSEGRFSATRPVPEHLAWDLWQGPAPARPYCDGLHPAQWRRFWAYGSGTLGDMACHYVDLVHWALELDHPVRVAVDGPGPAHEDGTPRSLEVCWSHPERALSWGKRGAVDVTWHDGGRRPEILGDLVHADGAPVQWGDGQLFIGDRGMILSDYGRHLLLPEEDFGSFERPAPSIPDSIGHHAEWIEAIRSGGRTTCDFAYSGPLSEAVLLGNVAYRAGVPLEWDAAALRATNAPDAERFVREPYRHGWTL